MPFSSALAGLVDVTRQVQLEGAYEANAGFEGGYTATVSQATDKIRGRVRTPNEGEW